MPKVLGWIFEHSKVSDAITENSMVSASAPTVSNILKSEEISSEGVVTSG